MTSPGHNSGDAADMNPQTAAQLKSIVERVERIEEEIKAFNADKSEVYAEAKLNGYDPKIIKQVVAIRRKPAADRASEEALLEIYLSAVEGA